MLLPQAVQDSAVLQLQDSDAAYLQFKGMRNVAQYYWVLYILMVVGIWNKPLRDLTKKKKQKPE